MRELPECVDGLPNICGAEEKVSLATRMTRQIHPSASATDFGRIKSAFAIALHMHQPLIPAGGGKLSTAEVISNLKHMMENQHTGDNHNAPVFHWCYKRIGEVVPPLVQEGKQPPVMLDYSGCLFHGLWQMGSHDVFDALERVTCDPADRKSTRLNSSHLVISYAVFCLKKKNKI